jgi:hypothetical protein
MTGRALLLASAVVAALAALPAGTAGAASLLEKNFYLSGPQYEGKLPPCFCSGVVEVTDGRKHAIHYSISEDTGMIGASWGIEWCVVGLDRNWSYNPACKMALP